MEATDPRSANRRTHPATGAPGLARPGRGPAGAVAGARLVHAITVEQRQCALQRLSISPSHPKLRLELGLKLGLVLGLDLGPKLGPELGLAHGTARALTASSLDARNPMVSYAAGGAMRGGQKTRHTRPASKPGAHCAPPQRFCRCPCPRPLPASRSRPSTPCAGLMCTSEERLRTTSLNNSSR
jgi:hypothetical protein